MDQDTLENAQLDIARIGARPEEIQFPNGNRARLVRAVDSTEAHELLRKLQLEHPRAVILIFGGAASLGDGLKARLVEFFSQGVAQLAASIGATIVDGGTHMGVMSLMGQGVLDRGRKTALLGVAPAGKVTYPGGPDEKGANDLTELDPNHSHFVLVEGDHWEVATGMLFQMVKALENPELGLAGPPGQRETAGQRPRLPVVAILAGGGGRGIARREVLESVRNGWPVVILEGSGGLADELAGQLREPRALVSDPELAEILQSGNLEIYPLEEPVSHFRQHLLRKLGLDEIPERAVNVELLLWAWERNAIYSQRARWHKSRYYQTQFLVILLGVFTTGLVLAHATLSRPDLAAAVSPVLIQWLRYAIIAFPILTSILFAIVNRRNDGSKWILLRNSAEAIKREIYRYRTRPLKAPERREKELARRNARLAKCVESVSHELMQTDANLSALDAYQGQIPPEHLPDGDDGLSFLTPECYIAIRLEHQLNYYLDRTSQKEKELNRVQILILLIGGFGTFLAAVGLELWVALTTSIAAAGATFLQYRQTENTLIHFNQTATNLSNVKGWWLALPVEERDDPENVEKLVDYTEKILESEHTGWMQNMQEALAGLRKDQAGEESA